MSLCLFTGNVRRIHFWATRTVRAVKTTAIVSQYRAYVRRFGRCGRMRRVQRRLSATVQQLGGFLLLHLWNWLYSGTGRQSLQRYAKVITVNY